MTSPALRPRADTIAERYTSAVVLSPTGIEMDAPVEAVSSRLLLFNPVMLPRGGALLAHGRLDSGGVALGLLKNDRWYRRVEITESGNFVAILEAAEPGRYTPILTNAAPKNRWRNRFVIFRFGAVDASATDESERVTP